MIAHALNHLAGNTGQPEQRKHLRQHHHLIEEVTIMMARQLWAGRPLHNAYNKGGKAEAAVLQKQRICGQGKKTSHTSTLRQCNQEVAQNMHTI
jgi:hypothetical protein